MAQAGKEGQPPSQTVVESNGSVYQVFPDGRKRWLGRNDSDGVKKGSLPDGKSRKETGGGYTNAPMGSE